MKEHKIVIDPDGNVRTLYTDMVNLREFGTLKIARASNIEWHEREQGWTVQFSDSSFLCQSTDGVFYATTYDLVGSNTCCFDTREQALAAEVAFLEAHL